MPRNGVPKLSLYEPTVIHCGVESKGAQRLRLPGAQHATASVHTTRQHHRWLANGACIRRCPLCTWKAFSKVKHAGTKIASGLVGLAESTHDRRPQGGQRGERTVPVVLLPTRLPFATRMLGDEPSWLRD